MVNETILAVITAFIISAVMCPIVIPFLHKLKFGQQVREDGPQAHLKKQGTPTMGGIVILGSVVITSLLYIKDYPKIIPILFMTVGFGVIGFLDDYIKIVMKRSEGLNPKQKLLGPDYHYGNFCLLSDQQQRGGNFHADSLYRRL